MYKRKFWLLLFAIAIACISMLLDAPFSEESANASINIVDEQNAKELEDQTQLETREFFDNAQEKIENDLKEKKEQEEQKRQELAAAQEEQKAQEETGNTVNNTATTAETVSVTQNQTSSDSYASYDYSDYNLYLLSHLIYGEAGSTWCSDELQLAVGSVVLNRIASGNYPNSLEGVIYQSGQYACTWDGNFDRTPDERTINNAAYLLNNGSVLPSGVVFQAQFVQGSGVYTVIQNMYFCY